MFTCVLMTLDVPAGRVIFLFLVLTTRAWRMMQGSSVSAVVHDVWDNMAVAAGGDVWVWV